jgi:hypothetical protein
MLAPAAPGPSPGLTSAPHLYATAKEEDEVGRV